MSQEFETQSAPDEESGSMNGVETNETSPNNFVDGAFKMEVNPDANVDSESAIAESNTSSKLAIGNILGEAGLIALVERINVLEAKVSNLSKSATAKAGKSAAEDGEIVAQSWRMKSPAELGLRDSSLRLFAIKPVDGAGSFRPLPIAILAKTPAVAPPPQSALCDATRARFDPLIVGSIHPVWCAQSLSTWTGPGGKGTIVARKFGWSNTIYKLL